MPFCGCQRCLPILMWCVAAARGATPATQGPASCFSLFPYTAGISSKVFNAFAGAAACPPRLASLTFHLLLHLIRASVTVGCAAAAAPRVVSLLLHRLYVISPCVALEKRRVPRLISASYTSSVNTLRICTNCLCIMPYVRLDCISHVSVCMYTVEERSSSCLCVRV